MSSTLLAIPSDPLRAYLQKGEVKNRYFNPGNEFSHVVLVDISPEPLSRSERKRVQAMVGEARLSIIHRRSRGRLRTLIRSPWLARSIASDAREHDVCCVRAFSPFAEGGIAAMISRQLKIPFLLSLHDNFDDTRTRLRSNKNWALLAFYLTWKPMETLILHQASHIIAVYGWARKYARDHGMPEESISVIYNKIDEEVFFPPRRKRRFKLPLQVVFVSRMVWEKGQDTLIKAMQGLEGQVRLTLVGDGPLRTQREELVRELGLREHVSIIPRVDNSELGALYRDADVLASPIRYGGVGIPILEAMATGLPIVHAIYPPERDPDVISEVAIRVPDSPESFRMAFRNLATDARLRDMLSRRSLTCFETLRERMMKTKEQNLYRSLCQ